MMEYALLVVAVALVTLFGSSVLGFFGRQKARGGGLASTMGRSGLPSAGPGAFGGAPGVGGGNTGGAVVSGQGVSFTRTAAGAEGSFTTTTITLPKSGRPTTVLISVSASAAQVQVSTLGGYFVSGVATAQVPLVLDISFLPEQTSIAVQTEAAAALVIQGTAGFQ